MPLMPGAPRLTRHIAFLSAGRYDEVMTDASRQRSLVSPSADLDRPELRASDADRDRTAALLGHAMATGRLTSTEYAQRLDAAYAATTLGDLTPLTGDLPADAGAGAGAGAGVGAAESAQVAARFSKVIRSGRWVAGRHTRLTARFGALIVNLAEAVLPGREITLDVDAFCGKLIVIVPADAQVIDEGGALFAKRAVYSHHDAGSADGPVIRLVGDARFSKVAVHRGHYDPSAPWQHRQRFAVEAASARGRQD
jgi:Domain of unknown function (DUF1707)